MIRVSVPRPTMTHYSVVERDEIHPDLLADLIRDAAGAMLDGPYALDWATFSVTLEPRPQPATQPVPSVYLDLVATAEILQ